MTVKKTSVYIPVEDLEALRRLSVRTGRSQAELIREGVRKVTAAHRRRPELRSMGIADGPAVSLEDLDDVLARSLWEEHRLQEQDYLSRHGSG